MSDDSTPSTTPAEPGTIDVPVEHGLRLTLFTDGDPTRLQRALEPLAID